jgi:hypothetical protein
VTRKCCDISNKLVIIRDQQNVPLGEAMGNKIKVVTCLRFYLIYVSVRFMCKEAKWYSQRNKKTCIIEEYFRNEVFIHGTQKSF